MITDSELLKLAEDWFKEQPINLGIKTAFAAGYRLAELKNCNLQSVSVSLPPDFKCCMVNEEIGCAFNGKKCHICTKAIESELSNYYAPFRRK